MFRVMLIRVLLLLLGRLWVCIVNIGSIRNRFSMCREKMEVREMLVCILVCDMLDFLGCVVEWEWWDIWFVIGVGDCLVL